MSKFLKIFLPAGAGTASMLAMAYVLADQLVVDLPAPIREAVAVQPAMADEAPAAPEAAAEVTLAMAAEPAAPSQPGGYGLGRAALPEEVHAWDHDVRPDGLGLPEGSGDVLTGEEVFVEKCASCHGDFGEAVGRWPVLAGGQGTLTNKDPVKTIGSYWPYLSTVFDYVQAAMPFPEPTTLTPDETYAITAYLLYVNDLVDEDFVLSKENFLEVEMPNAGGFKEDDRIETEFPLFTQAVCMENCKETVEITMHASNLDVTPGDDSDNVVPAAAEEPAPAAAEEPAATTEEAAAEPAAEPAAAEMAAVDPALVEAGAAVFRKCQSCHQVGEGAVNRTGPELNGILGRVIGSVDGFRYSATFADAMAAGQVWDADNLSAFLENPRGSMPGTKMSFAGLRNADDRAAVIAYLQSMSAN